MKLILQIILIGILTSCSVGNSISNKASTYDWRQLHGRLYIGPNNELGFATDPEIANVPRTELEGERCKNVFLTTIGSNGGQSLKSVIDTSTFVELGASYFKDKNNIYNYYAMCEGGYLNIFSRDTSNFKVLNDCYVQNDSIIYHFRNGTMGADLKTFKASSIYSCVAKDKNGYFEYGKRTTKEQLISAMGEDSFSKIEQELSGDTN